LDAAFPPMSITVALEDELDLSRGEMLCRPANRPQVTRDLDATVCWMHETPLEVGGRYALKQTTRTVAARVDRLEYRIDVHELHRDPTATRLELNDIGRVRLRTAAPLFVDDYRRNRLTGSFILIDESTNDTVAAGIVVTQGSGTAAAATHSPNVVWQHGPVTRERRWAALGQRGATLWLTGLPGSGKTTIAGALEARLVERGCHVYVLDGDNLRHGLNSDLGFDAAARAENVRRAAEAARLLADAGAIVIVSLISPYQADRARARAIHDDAGLAFLEVFVDTPLDECERRDPKGLYARARRGEIRGFTGVDDPYEAPEAPETRLRTVDSELDQELDALEQLLTRRGVIEPGEPGR